MANTFACLVILTIVVQQTSCADDLANTVSTVGANVTMRCKTRSGNCSGVTWGIGTNVISIYKGEVGFLGSYGSRYSVDNTSGCHLIVKNVQLTDAGRFSCIDESPPTTIYRSAELIVLESEPKCHVSAFAETTVEGDRVNLSCEVIFNGTNRVSMTWKDMENIPPSTKTGKTVRLSHNITAERKIDPSYECVASFKIETNGTDLVKNIPTVSCKTPSIKILYGVKSAELTPSQSIHFPGSVVTCSSDGNPPPTFKWQESEMENGPWKDVADVTGPEFTTSNETSLYYRCVTSNVVKNIHYNATSSIFRINYPEQSNNTVSATETVTGSTNFQHPLVSITEGRSAGVDLFILVAIAISCCVVLLVIIIVVCCCTRKCPCYRCCSSRENSKAKNSYDDGEPLKANPANNSEHLVKNSKPRPPPSGDPPKRPKEAPPQPKPRTDLQKVPQPQQNNYQQEEVTYAALESEMAPHRNRALPAVVAESEYADISKA